jgi:hypothetical protein
MADSLTKLSGVEDLADRLTLLSRLGLIGDIEVGDWRRRRVERERGDMEGGMTRGARRRWLDSSSYPAGG